MTLFNEYLKEVIKEVIGNDAVVLIDYLDGRENVSEFKLAEVLNLNINQTRNILYRLNAQNLVFSSRKKDKKKGWYIYFWTLNLRRALELIVKLKREKLDYLTHQIKKLEEEAFFYCANDKLTLSFEAALEHEFRCPEDGQVLVKKDFTKEVAKMKNDIAKINDFLHGDALKALEGMVEEKEEILAKKRNKKAERKKQRKLKKKAKKIKKTKKISKKKTRKLIRKKIKKEEKRLRSKKHF